ncbi:MAG: succinyl-diaminopimelate desuccinylase [Candidatus Tokpelaia sp. JSC085]|nr:MAG: succinyl-diaminopimelate desuccinylase [Candidatus Tokpelaia sp. JSC085]
MTIMQYADPVYLLQELIRYRSVTPDEGGALSFLQKIAKTVGFTVDRPVFSDCHTPDVENLYAKYGVSSPCLMFAGHTDVVPPGDKAQWSHPAFSGNIVDGVLYGRGAVDMKGSIVCFLAALIRIFKKKPINGSISLLITGDEEGPAVNGTIKLLQWAAARGEAWDAALVGEPTCTESLGDTIKIGRRGSLSGVLRVNGIQGHVAYPHLAHNPLPNIITLLGVLVDQPLDTGSKHFQPSNLEIVNIDSGNKINNLIPAHVEAWFNIRFNDLWSPATLMAEIERRLDEATQAILKKNRIPVDYAITWMSNPAAVFLTKNDWLISTISNAILKITGQTPETSTAGGTSDARFIKDYCPVVEFGLVGKTMHKIDECVAVDDLEKLTMIYQSFIEQIFSNKENTVEGREGIV